MTRAPAACAFRDVKAVRRRAAATMATPAVACLNSARLALSRGHRRASRADSPRAASAVATPARPRPGDRARRAPIRGELRAWAPVTIPPRDGGATFATPHEMMGYFSGVLKDAKLCRYLDGEARDAVASVLRAHPDASRKMGRGAPRGFQVRQDPEKGYRYFVVQGRRHAVPGVRERQAQGQPDAEGATGGGRKRCQRRGKCCQLFFALVGGGRSRERGAPEPRHHRLRLRGRAPRAPRDRPRRARALRSHPRPDRVRDAEQARGGGADGGRVRRVLCHTGPHTTAFAW